VSSLVGRGVTWRGLWRQRQFDGAARNPELAQARYLARLLRRHCDTAFGREHSFDRIRGPREYARRVPIRDYEQLRPWMTRLLAGEPSVLTREAPLMFATTSGTAARPKLVPVTARWLAELGGVMTLWLHRAQLDHPGLFSGRIVSLVSPAVESLAPDGTPIGSVSGLTYRKTPWFVRKTYVLPYEVAEIADYDHRYLVAARLMLQANVSLVATPNPSTLLRLVQEGADHAETIVRAVRDGTLGVRPDPEREDATRQREVYARLERGLRPDPHRAKEMAAHLDRDGALLPRSLWPGLSMIGCWLGGSAGVQAERLLGPFGPVALRDLGLRATEGTVTIPLEDGTAAGPLALTAGFFEFVPEEDIERGDPRVRLAHELEDGGRYYILLTTSAGLYRYDINDIVEVRGFRGRIPNLAFVRKGRDMVSLTGEKLHSTQIGEAAERAARELGVPCVQVQLIPDGKGMCYDLLVEGGDPDRAEEFTRAFDEHLRGINIEYEQKRASRRLGPPRVHRMKAGWSARRRHLEVERDGKRDAQYKWPLILMEWDTTTRAEVEQGEEAD